MPSSLNSPVTVTLHDGRHATIRPIRRDDLVRNAEFLEQLSSPSKHFLFLGGIARLSDAALNRLCDPDYTHDMAYIATTTEGDHERQVGVCRYALADAKTGAEISVAVADDWQHQGLGQLLLARLIDYARERGVQRLYSMDTVNNEAMRHLAREMGFTERPDPDDIRQVIYSRQP